MYNKSQSHRCLNIGNYRCSGLSARTPSKRSERTFSRPTGSGPINILAWPAPLSQSHLPGTPKVPKLKCWFSWQGQAFDGVNRRLRYGVSWVQWILHHKHVGAFACCWQCSVVAAATLDQRNCSAEHVPYQLVPGVLSPASQPLPTTSSSHPGDKQIARQPEANAGLPYSLPRGWMHCRIILSSQSAMCHGHPALA
ncbi:hypothetical protein LIA77_10931 [Sarocladium implicatum]|nr:hypothetical protein LIA77_10931 [Sarocladium implicatum]